MVAQIRGRWGELDGLDRRSESSSPLFESTDVQPLWFTSWEALTMAIRDIGPLLGADEGLTHQIVDTFATVADSDYSWTEKIWTSMAMTDGTLQVDLGLGKYHNRGVIDGFGGVSRGREQWTVRGSRELHSAPEDAAIGPIVYEVVEPLHSVCVRLEPNDVQPISFDLVLSGVTPPFFEDRNLTRNRRTNRVDTNVIRYHQGGWATGTVTVEGETYTFDGENAYGFRDHSWGVRQGVGVPAPDLIGATQAIPRGPGARRGIMKWTPSFFCRPDGSYYETAIFIASVGWNYASAYINQANGTQERVRSAEPQMQYDPHTRFLRNGEVHLVMETGKERTIDVEVLGESGFFLKTAGYGSWKDQKHGSWLGPMHLDGEYISDCWADDLLGELGQLRDTPIRVREGDAVGYGIMESIITGEWPEFGLTPESDRGVFHA